MYNSETDRRRRYDENVGERVVKRQQSLSASRRFMRDFAMNSDVYELLDIYFSRQQDAELRSDFKNYLEKRGWI